MERHVAIPETEDNRLRLAPYQRGALKKALEINHGQFTYSTIVWSDLKKTAKCLAPDTELIRSDGSPIIASRLKAGDGVLSWKDRELCFAYVTALEWQPPSDCYRIRTARGRSITVSSEHPFLAWDHRWSPASQLWVGQWVSVCNASHTGTVYDRIADIERVPACETIAVEVSSTHTHVTNGFVTHNTTIAGSVALWMAFRKPLSRVRLVGNDLKQADSRVFGAIDTAIKLNPAWRESIEVVPSRHLIKFPNGSVIESVALDPKGEAGGNDDMVSWTELWAARSKAHKDVWTEMTLSPTKFGQSFRWIDTYAGYTGESPILEQLYMQTVKEGRRVDLSFYEHGTHYDLSDVPAYENRPARVFCLWNDKPRLAWLTPEYYAEESGALTESEFLRIHRNLWSQPTNLFIPSAWWEACRGDIPTYGGEVCIGALDAAVSNDCFGVILITFQQGKTLVRYARAWYPPKGGKIDLSEPEAEVRRLAKEYHVIWWAYDPHQLERMAMEFNTEGVGYFASFNQGDERLVADKMLYDSIRDQLIVHNGDAELTQHVLNANAEQGPLQREKLRLVKRSDKQKIDLAVCLSMANYIARKELNLS
jgi:phage terminase large subunit-like protein